MSGELSILNVGEGDTVLSFDSDKPGEVKRARAAVSDMLRRGFAILVEVGQQDGKPLYQRATDFDADTNEYIIVGAPPETSLDDGPPLSDTVDAQARVDADGKPLCDVNDGDEWCDRTARTKGMCQAHYARWKKNGDPGPVAIGRPGRTRRSKPKPKARRVPARSTRATAVGASAGGCDPRGFDSSWLQHPKRSTR